MSDVMLFGVLRMPFEIAMSNELSQRQFYDRVQEALGRMEAAEASLQAAEPDSVPDGGNVWLLEPSREIACSSCGLTMEQSYLLAHLKSVDLAQPAKFEMREAPEGGVPGPWTPCHLNDVTQLRPATQYRVREAVVPHEPMLSRSEVRRALWVLLDCAVKVCDDEAVDCLNAELYFKQATAQKLAFDIRTLKSTIEDILDGAQPAAAPGDTAILPQKTVAQHDEKHDEKHDAQSEPDNGWFEQQRQQFEAIYPTPDQTIWIGRTYASTGYNAWSAQAHCQRWDGWIAQAKAVIPQAIAKGRYVDNLSFIARYASASVRDGERAGAAYWADALSLISLRAKEFLEELDEGK